jgi:hypothetical protein
MVTALRLWAWNGLPLNTYISMHARTNRCYNERDSKTKYVRSSILHCTIFSPCGEISYNSNVTSLLLPMWQNCS